MRIDYRDRTIDDKPMRSDWDGQGKVINRETGEEIGWCFLVDDQTGEWGQYVVDEKGEYQMTPDRREPMRRFGKCPLMIILEKQDG